MLARVATLVAILAMTACTSTPSHPSWQRYTCDDGQTIQAAYPDANTALIKFHGETHILHIALSGSGARYTGDSWQWWTKGMREGMLAPLAAGESIASAPGVTCHTD